MSLDAGCINSRIFNHKRNSSLFAKLTFHFATIFRGIPDTNNHIRIVFALFHPIKGELINAIFFTALINSNNSSG